jgi:conjugative relaxase-like TrwC/TraI family protein
LAQVLRLAKLPEGGHAYYLQVAAGTGSGIEKAGRWVGSGPAELGLGGEVAADPLAAVLAGRHPATDVVLGGARHRVTVAGFDLTFAAPKSVSLLHALGEPAVADEVGAGHDAAVHSALDYVERRALGVRRSTAGIRRVEPAAGTATAAFAHRTSRAQDPHLHTHVVMANLARGPDGRWGALDGRGLYAHAAAAGAVYHAQLRYELRSRLGVAWGPADRGRADIEGIGPTVRRAFSTRASQIAAELDRVRTELAAPPSARTRHVAWAVTRAARDVEQPVESLVPEWRARAVALGLGPRALDAVIDRVPRRAPEAPALADVQRGVVAQLSGRASLTRRDVVRASCAMFPDGASAPVAEATAAAVLDGLMRAAGEGAPGSRRRDAPPIDGPGVAERRIAAPARGVDELDVLLARRGIERTGRDLARSRGRSAEGPYLGWGIG